MASLLEEVYPEARFGGFSHVDGSVVFYTRVDALLDARMTVLDIGCGRGLAADDPIAYRRRLRVLRGRAARVIGIDVDPAGARNPTLDEFRPITDVARWPIEDGLIDLAISDYVLEHVDVPAAFFAEAWRVLKPGGHLCLRTTNAHSYIAAVARLVPNRLHPRVVAKVSTGRRDEDVFPTRYRCNTRATLAAALGAAGFEHQVNAIEGEPGYLHFSRLAYRAGAVVHRLLPEALRSSLVAFARKPA